VRPPKTLFPVWRIGYTTVGGPSRRYRHINRNKARFPASSDGRHQEPPRFALSPVCFFSNIHSRGLFRGETPICRHFLRHSSRSVLLHGKGQLAITGRLWDNRLRKRPKQVSRSNWWGQCINGAEWHKDHKYRNLIFPPKRSLKEDSTRSSCGEGDRQPVHLAGAGNRPSGTNVGPI